MRHASSVVDGARRRTSRPAVPVSADVYVARSLRSASSLGALCTAASVDTGTVLRVKILLLSRFLEVPRSHTGTLGTTDPKE
jgi:hypothetical protein